MPLVDHLEKLVYLKRIAGFPSLKGAARSAGVSQSALSKTLAALEGALGVQLMQRSPSGVRFTPEGRALLSLAEEIIERAERFDARIRPKREPPVRRVRLGAYDSIAVYLFPQVIERFDEQFRDLAIDLHVQRSQELLEGLETNRLDVVVGAFAPLTRRGIASETLFEDTLSFFASPSYDAHRRKLTFVDFPRAALDARAPPSVTKRIAEGRLVSCENFETVKELAIAGLGVGILPRRVAAPEVRRGRLVATAIRGVPRHFCPHTVTLATRTADATRFAPILEELKKAGHAEWLPDDRRSLMGSTRRRTGAA